MNTVCCILPSCQNCLHELLSISYYRDRRYFSLIFFQQTQRRTYSKTFKVSVFKVILSKAYTYSTGYERMRIIDDRAIVQLSNGDRELTMTRYSIASSISHHRVIAIVSSCHRTIIISLSHHRIIVIALSHHRFIVIALSRLCTIDPNLDGAIVSYMALSGFRWKACPVVKIRNPKRPV